MFIRGIFWIFGKEKLCLYILIWLIVTVALFKISLFHSFGDENDTFVAGWLILKGLIPYQDFFFHHAPLTFFLAGLAEWMTPGRGLITMRWLVVFLHSLVWLWLFLNSHPRFRKSLAISMLMISFWIVPNFNLQMMLPDTLITLSLILWSFSTLGWITTNQPNLTQVIKIGLLATIVCIDNSIASTVPIGAIWLFIGIKVFSAGGWISITSILKNHQKLFIWSLITQFIWLVYFGIHDSLSKFWWSVFTFNQKYYFPLHLADGELELKFGMLFRIVNQFGRFLISQTIMLGQAIWVFGLSLLHLPQVIINDSPSSILPYLTVVNHEFFQTITQQRMSWLIGLLVIGLFLLQKHWKLFFMAIFLAASLWFRSNEVFHLAPFVTELIIGLSIIITGVISTKSTTKELVWKIMAGLSLSLMAISLQPQMMQTLAQKPPIIKPNSLSMAEIIANNVHGEKALVVGGENLLYYLANVEQSSVYGHYYPWFAQTDTIKQEVSDQLTNSIPKVVIFDPAGEHDFRSDFYPIIAKNYILIDDRGIWVR